MNSLLAYLLAAMLADSAGQLAGTPRGEQPTIAERALSCGCDYSVSSAIVAITATYAKPDESGL